jgi:hypothetical protein
LFHNADLFGSCIIHILCTGCGKIKKKNNSGAKGLIKVLATTYCDAKEETNHIPDEEVQNLYELRYKVILHKTRAFF